MRSTWSTWMHQLRNWEFWPFSVVYFPINFYYGWLVLKTRSLFFFTAANPSIDFGGMLGESKKEIFEMIPNGYLPKFQRFSNQEIKAALEYAHQIGYPLIAKPDIGERGKWVEKITDDQSLMAYMGAIPVDFLLQELVELPIELGVFYVRFPNESKGRVTSLVEKEFLHVIGDGQSTVSQLLAKNPRAQLQFDFDHNRFKEILQQVPESGQNMVVEKIGNHCRGTTFLDRNDQIDSQLHEAIDQLSQQIPEFYFGRFDIRCQSIADLKELKNFKILELNGAGSEPGHIYHPGRSIWKGYGDIVWHLHALATISQQNNSKGVDYWKFAEGMRKLSEIKAYNRLTKIR